MSMTTLGVVFVIALFSCIAVMAHFTRRRILQEPHKDAPARRSAVAEFADDIQNHRWTAIIAVALLIAVDKYFRISGGLLQSRLVLAIVITVFFVGRQLLRERQMHTQANPVPSGMNPPEQDR